MQMFEVNLIFCYLLTFLSHILIPVFLNFLLLPNSYYKVICYGCQVLSNMSVTLFAAAHNCSYKGSAEDFLYFLISLGEGRILI